MRQFYFSFVVACLVVVPTVAIAQEPTDVPPKDDAPVLAVSYDNWWMGKHAFAFHADGSFTFELRRKRFDSHVTGTGKLPPERIEKLLSALKEKGFFRISKESIEKQIELEGGRKAYNTDQNTYRIAIHHAEYKQRIEYYDVFGDAERFPKAADLQVLKECVTEIRQLLDGATSIR